MWEFLWHKFFYAGTLWSQEVFSFCVKESSLSSFIKLYSAKDLFCSLPICRYYLVPPECSGAIIETMDAVEFKEKSILFSKTQGFCPPLVLPGWTSTALRGITATKIWSTLERSSTADLEKAWRIEAVFWWPSRLASSRTALV